MPIAPDNLHQDNSSSLAGAANTTQQHHQSMYSPEAPSLPPNGDIPLSKRPNTTIEQHENELQNVSLNNTAVALPEEDPETNEDGTHFVGLSNQGATCYLNSLVQALFMTPEIRNALYKWRYDPKIHGSAERSIPYQLQRLFVLLEKSKQKAVRTENLTKAFGWTSRDAFVQHDINELCRLLFDALDKSFAPNLYRMRDELSKANTDEEKEKIKQKYKDRLESDSLMTDLYTGFVTDYIHAKGHFNEDGKPIGRERKDKFLDLQLVVHNISSLEDSLKHYVNPEQLTGDNKWHCDDLDSLVDATKGFRFESFPPILTLHLKRFDYDMRTWTPVKLGHRIEFPFELDLKDYVPENYPYETKYELFSCLIHSGSVRAGHYFAYIKNLSDNKWYEFNDSHVSEITEEDVKRMYGRDDDVSAYSSTNAYMLMYRRIDSDVLDNRIHTDCISEDLLEWIEKENAKWEEERRQEEIRRNTLSFRIYHMDGSNQKETSSSRGGFNFQPRAPSVQIKMLKHHTIGELKMKAIEEFIKKESEDSSASPNDADSSKQEENGAEDASTDGQAESDANEKTEQSAPIWERPSDCFRIRELERYSDYEMGKVYANEQAALKEISTYGYEIPLALQSREEDADWPKDQRSISVYVQFLNSDTQEFSKESMDLNCSMTVKELREFFSSQIDKDTTYPSERVGIIKKDYPFKITNIIEKENMDRTIEEIGLEAYDDLYVEVLEKEGAPSQSQKLLELSEYYYILFVNQPGTRDYSIRYQASKKETLADMKANISKLIDIPVTEFRMGLVNPDGSVRAPLDNEYRKLSVVPRIHNDVKIHVERGKSLAPGEFMIDIYRYITEREYFRRSEVTRKRERADLLKHNMDKEKTLNKEKPASDSPADAASPSDRSSPVEQVQAQQDQDDSPLVNPENHREFESVEEKTKSYVLSNYDRVQLFTLVNKFIVSNDMQVSELQKQIAKALPEEIDPECIRVRLRNGNDADKILTPTDKTLKNLLPSLHRHTELCFQVLQMPEELPSKPMILNIRRWYPSTWTFGAASEVVLDTQSTHSMDDLRKVLSPIVDIPEEYLGVHKSPRNIDHRYKGDCEKVALLDWTMKAKNIYRFPMRLDNSDTILFRDMRDEEKHNLEQLKKDKFSKKSLHSGIGSGIGSRSVSYSRWRSSEPEQQLKITTEFDEQLEEQDPASADDASY